MGIPATIVPGQATLGDRVFQNIVTLIAGRGFGLILSGVTFILLARYLETEQLGQYGALFAYVALFAWIASFGLESILAREAAKNREQAGSILLTGVLLSAVFSLAAAGISVLLAPHFGYRGELQLFLVFAAVDVLILAPLRLPGIIFQVDLRQWYGVGIGLLRQILWLVALVLMATLKAGFIWVIVGRLACSIFEVGLTLVVISQRGYLARPWSLASGKAKNLILSGFPIAVSAVAVGVYNRIDQVMLHSMTNDTVLGGYVAAVNVTELLTLLPVALAGSLFPILSRFSMQNDRFDHYLRLSFRSMMAIVFGACAIVAPLATPIIQLLYGPKFAAAGPLLAVLIWSEIPVFFGVLLTTGLIAKNLQNYLPLSTVLGAIVNVVLNLFLIPRWGAFGAAWATNISYALAGIFLFLGFRPTRPMAWVGFRVSIVPFFLALLIAGLFLVIHVQFAVELSIIVTAYGFGVWITGVVESSEIGRMRQLILRNYALIRSNVS